MSLRILLANTLGRVGTWYLSRADRDVCRMVNESDES